MAKSATLSVAIPAPTSAKGREAVSPGSLATSSSLSTSSTSPSHEIFQTPPICCEGTSDLAGTPRNTLMGVPSAHITAKSPAFTSLPPYPSSPRADTQHFREQSKSLFGNIKASKSSSRISPTEGTIRQVSEDNTSTQTNRENTIYSIRKSPGSTPNLGNFPSAITPAAAGDSQTSLQQTTSNNFVSTTAQSDTALYKDQPHDPGAKKSKFAHLLTRTRSIHLEDGGRKSKPTTPTLNLQTEYPNHSEAKMEAGGMRTAPLRNEQDRAFRDMMGSVTRNRSADRQPDQAEAPMRHAGRAPQGPALLKVQDPREDPFRSTGSHHTWDIKSTSTKVTDGIGKASRLFGKIGRNNNKAPREGLTEEHYEYKTIRLPLVEQTRQTRIAKRLEDSKDKTEFWMPSLPWRCIDYLNYRGCEEEGLYRVPGSGPKIKEYERKFDKELDVILFNEPELYDINIIGSMFKAWLRELPGEIFPKATQARIAAQCQGATEVPQILKDELSQLPPWNYYLLFATTCHLSLLHAYADKNRMNYSNICICFQPCLKVDGFCFHFLVVHWRECWQGCWTEKAALKNEYRILDAVKSRGADNSSTNGSLAASEDSSIPSSSSYYSDKSTVTGRNQKVLTLNNSGRENLASTSMDADGQSKADTHLPELSPVQPLSPIGL